MYNISCASRDVFQLTTSTHPSSPGPPRFFCRRRRDRVAARKGEKKKDPSARHILFSHESCLGIWQGSACWKIDESGSVFREGFFTRSLTRCSLDGVKDGGDPSTRACAILENPLFSPGDEYFGWDFTLGLRWCCIDPAYSPPNAIFRTHTHTLQMIAVLCDFGAHRVAR